MNRLFEALSEIEPARKAADPGPLLLVPMIDAQTPVCPDPDALPMPAEASEPEIPTSQTIPADFLPLETDPAVAQPHAESGPPPASAPPEEIFPSDMASLIRVFQAEMDQMAVKGFPTDLAASGQSFAAPETRRDLEATAVAVAYPEFAVSEVPLCAPSWEMEANLASIELQFTTADSASASLAFSEDAAQIAIVPPVVKEAHPETFPIAVAAETEAPSLAQDMQLPEDIFPSGMPSLVLVLEPESEERSSDAQPANTLPSAAVETICEPKAVVEQPLPEEVSEAILPCEPPLLVLEPDDIIEQFALDFSFATAPADAAIAAPNSGVDATASRPKPESIEAVNVPETPESKLEAARRVYLKAPAESRLVALTEPDSMGAEKFRALVSRLEHQHRQCELKSFQVTSSVISEGKTLVSGNVAATLARHLGAKTLLVEGDLHRPTLAAILGLDKMRGLHHWWSGRTQDLSQFVYKVEDLPLWFLPAGKPCDRPSDLLRSARFANAFREIAGEFEWTVVDSTPMVPIVDVNLWSRLVDGTLLVVREGVTPVKALKQGLLALDHPNLIGMVLNDAVATTNSKYDGQYYGPPKRK